MTNGNGAPAARIWTSECSGFRPNPAADNDPAAPQKRHCHLEATWEMVVRFADDPKSAKKVKFCPDHADEMRRDAARRGLVIESEAQICNH